LGEGDDLTEHLVDRFIAMWENGGSHHEQATVRTLQAALDGAITPDAMRELFPVVACHPDDDPGALAADAGLSCAPREAVMPVVAEEMAKSIDSTLLGRVRRRLGSRACGEMVREVMVEMGAPA
jgi:Glu-tRNA(Gln) amidotransferase subunit E-like FAD-binding protein